MGEGETGRPGDWETGRKGDREKRRKWELEKWGVGELEKSGKTLFQCLIVKESWHWAQGSEHKALSTDLYR
jgi:hypothetical protein